MTENLDGLNQSCPLESQASTDSNADPTCPSRPAAIVALLAAVQDGHDVFVTTVLVTLGLLGKWKIECTWKELKII